MLFREKYKSVGNEISESQDSFENIRQIKQMPKGAIRRFYEAFPLA